MTFLPRSLAVVSTMMLLIVGSLTVAHADGGDTGFDAVTGGNGVLSSASGSFRANSLVSEFS